MYVEQKRRLIGAFQGHQPITELDLHSDHVKEHVFSHVYVKLKLPIHLTSENASLAFLQSFSFLFFFLEKNGQCHFLFIDAASPCSCLIHMRTLRFSAVKHFCVLFFTQVLCHCHKETTAIGWGSRYLLS